MRITHSFPTLALTALLSLGIIACNTSPSTPIMDGTRKDKPAFIATVQIGAADTDAALEARFDGTLLSRDETRRMAIIATNTRPSGEHVLGIDTNGQLHAPVTIQAGDVPLTPEATARSANIWMGGWSAWSGGWSAWSGGWSAWSGGTTPSAPAENNAIWDAIRLRQAHRITRNFGAGAKIAVIDTGLDTAHPMFTGRLAPSSEWRDFVDNDNNPQEVGTTSDPGFGHGTGVAGVILQVAPRATILPIRVMNKDGMGDLDNVIKGINHAVASGANIINLSLGTFENYTALSTVLQTTANNKVLIVASAGNEGRSDTITYPAQYIWTGTIGQYLSSVGSVDTSNRFSSFSNRADTVFNLAPGENITSAFPGNRTAKFTGTSFAAPLVTGILAVALREASWADPGTLLSHVWRGAPIGNLSNTVFPTNQVFRLLEFETYLRNLYLFTPAIEPSNTNLIQNPGFESDTSPWTGWGSTVTRGTTRLSGSFGATLIGTSSLCQTVTGLNASTNYVVVARAQNTARDQDGLLTVSSSSGLLTTLSYGNSGMYWPHLHLAFSTGPSTTSATICIKNYAGTSNVDDFELRAAGF